VVSLSNNYKGIVGTYIILNTTIVINDKCTTEYSISTLIISNDYNESKYVYLYIVH